MQRHQHKGSLLLIIFILVSFLHPAMGGAEPYPSVKNGRIDLSSFDFTRPRLIDLRGDWAFRWMDLVDPAAEPNEAAWSRYPVPAVWGKGAAPAHTGCATYRLVIIPPASTQGDDGRLALAMPSIDCAYSVFIDGKQSFSSGVVATDHSLPRWYAPIVLSLPDDGKPIEVLIQVSSFGYPRSGLRDSILVGPKAALDRRAMVGEFIDLCLFGGILVMGVFFLALFMTRRRSKELLLFSFMCFIVAFKALITGQGMLYRMGLMEWTLGSLFEYVCNCLFCSLTLLYLRTLFRKLASPRLALALSLVGLAFALFCVVTPILIYAQIIYLIFIYVAASVIFSIPVLIRLVRTHDPGALPFSVGLAFVLLAGLNDTLYSMRIIHSTNLVQVGLSAFLVCQAFIIARRFVRLIDMEDRLAGELEIETRSGFDLTSGRENIIEEKVSRTLEASRKKDALLLTQSRQAAMGELVSHISHQWKQPLNVLSLILQSMSAESEVGFLPRASVERFSSMGMGQIGAMASILDDYKDYFREDKEKRVFGLNEVAETTIRLQAPIIARLGVETSVSCPEGLAYFGLRNECSQILTNLVVNALDAIAERKPELPRIDIVISQESGAIAIEVRDSGGGMAEATLARLFEPYFTTKAKGTGIGLYICKAMLERDFGGSLSARNEGPGSAFTARLGLGGER